jgi:hypothetical protein
MLCSYQVRPHPELDFGELSRAVEGCLIPNFLKSRRSRLKRDLQF